MLVATFLDEPVVVDKLNEGYYRTGIPRPPYERLGASA